ncbi:MAG: glycosyltransferase family 39 protein [Lachnospiraceae bacterium]|nr:glycosyltransferase family 39 protein [Lachnospiraceae bacterium]
MKKTGQLIELISEKGIKVLAIIILGWLTFWQAIRTFRLPFDYIEEYVREYPDSPIKNLLFLLFCIIFFFLIQKVILRGDTARQKKTVFVIALIDIFIVGILLSAWVSICDISPYWDQLEVLNAASGFRQGDFGNMEYNYLQMYTQHYGLIFFEEFFLGIWNNYRIFQYLNVLFIMMIIFLFYRVTDLFFDSPRISLYSLMSVTVFIPMHVYVVYVYGDLGSIALCMLCLWALLKWNITSKLRYVLIALFSASIATLIRQNSLIILLAILIGMVIHAWKTWNWKKFVVAIAVLVLPLLSVQLVEGIYEIRSGREIGAGLPAVVWFSMGIQQDSNGVGFDTAYDESIWWHSDCDPEKTAEAAIKDIKHRWEEIKGDPALIRELIRYKALEQWIEPTFTSFTMTGKFEEPANAVVETLYFGTLPDYICRFMNFYLFVIYACAFLWAIRGVFRKEGMLTSIMLIAFVGGFLFGMIWEAKGRYMMPYAMMLIPYMACGLSQTQEKLLSLFQKGK